MYLTHDENAMIKSAIDKVAENNEISRRKAREIVFSAIGTAEFMTLVKKGVDDNGNGCNSFESA